MLPSLSTTPPFDRDELGAALIATRTQTLQLFAACDPETFTRQIHPAYSPVGWHLGHIGFTEALWILEHCAGQTAPQPDYRQLLAADGLPKHLRCELPDFETLLTYLQTVRSRVEDYLAIAPVEQQARLWLWLLQHECQHNETIAFLLHLDRGLLSPPQTPWSCPPPEFDMVTIPGGEFVMGRDRLDAQDNERPVHRQQIATFELDRYPVTVGQYREFMAAGGYQRAECWSAAGWAWVQQTGSSQPLHWSEAEIWRDHPVYGVSYYEAEAYARWAGKRLPTEAEWEKAASYKSGSEQSLTYPWGEDPPGPQYCNYSHHLGHTTPVTAYPQGQSPSGCWDLLGNVWEWTDSWFAGYAGFQAYPYRGYSEVYFDGQHRVMRGGSWVTRSRGLRNSFRNWYEPWVREICVGFRCAR